jgi:hypothetical protein
MDCHRTCNHNHQTLCNELDEFLQKMEILPPTKAVKGLAKSPSAGHANTKAVPSLAKSPSAGLANTKVKLKK